MVDETPMVRRRRKLKEAGLCQECGKTKAKTRCEECLKKRRKYQKRTAQKRAQAVGAGLGKTVTEILKESPKQVYTIPVIYSRMGMVNCGGGYRVMRGKS